MTLSELVDTNVLHIVRDLRETLSLQESTEHNPELSRFHHDGSQDTNSEESWLPGTLVCSKYPPAVARAAARLPSQEGFFSNIYLYRDLWCKVMSHFFPLEEGFTISHNYPNNLTQGGAISFVIKCSNSLRFPLIASSIPFSSQQNGAEVSSDVSLALINLCSPLDFPSSLLRDFAVHESQQRANEAVSSRYWGTLLIVTTMGRAWRAQKRVVWGDDEESRSRGYHTGNLNSDFASDRGMTDSEWMEDVMSEPSWEILVRMCDDVKLQFQKPRVLDCSVLSTF